MNRVAFHGALAALGLFLAWWAWTAEDAPQRPEGTVDVVECERVSRVSLESEGRDAVLERKGEDDAFFWVTADRKDGVQSTRTEFVGGAAAKKLMEERLAPFAATRSLGEVSDAGALKELGFEETTSTLELRCDGATHSFAVGTSAFGSGDRYVRAKDGEVFLVDGEIITDLESAEFRLMQRELVGADWTEVETLEVSGFGQQIVLRQRNRQDPHRALWVDAADPDRRNELYGNWLGRVRGLRVSDYLAPDAAPGSDLEDAGDAEPVALLTFKDAGGDTLETLRLVRVEAGESVHWYGQSDATRSWVSLTPSVARQVEDDLRLVLGMDPLPEPVPVPASAPDGVAPGAAPPGATDTGVTDTGAAPGTTPPGGAASGGTPNPHAPNPHAPNPHASPNPHAPNPHASPNPHAPPSPH